MNIATKSLRNLINLKRGMSKNKKYIIWFYCLVCLLLTLLSALKSYPGYKTLEYETTNWEFGQQGGLIK